jgi:hypothetical protein
MAKTAQLRTFDVAKLLEQQIYDLRIDSAYLRTKARETAEPDTALLHDAAHKIMLLSKRLERMAKL